MSQLSRPNLKVVNPSQLELSLADEDVVAYAEQLLADAKAGRVRGLLVAKVFDDGYTDYDVVGVFADAPVVGLTMAQRLVSRLEGFIFWG
jgi:hypothetical protein